MCLFFNLAKLQCKQTVVTDFCIGFVNKIHIIGKNMIKETWIAKIKEIGCWTEELITFCPFSPVSAWSKKLPNFAVKHVDLSWDFGHDVPCMGRRIDVNNEGGLDTRPSSFFGKLNPGCTSRRQSHAMPVSCTCRSNASTRRHEGPACFKDTQLKALE